MTDASSDMNLPLAPDQPPEERAVNPDALMTMGEIMSLATQSADHREYTLSQLEQRFLVPASLDQIRIYRTEVEPIAVVTWALVTDELHEQLLKGPAEIPNDAWRSGDHLWLMETLVKPVVADMVYDDLTQTVFPNKIGHMWITNDEGELELETYYGANRQGDAQAGTA